MKKINKVISVIITVCMFFCVFRVNTFAANTMTVSSYSQLVSAIKTMEASGGTVLIDAKKIDCTGQIKLSSTSGKNVTIEGVKQADGTYPILDFLSFRQNTIGKQAGKLIKSSDSHVGIRITGTNYNIKNVIIQKAPDNGIQIKGATANNNSVKNCIVRYNNDSGIQITSGASNNEIRFVYSYRNCDVYSLGGNADGFAPKLAAGKGNSFYGCYSWDNSDDGWDSYDKTDGLTYDVSYEQCACWNNGNSDVFTGRYDFDNKNEIDTDLFLVELISNEDSSFVSNYKSGKFNLPTSNIINTSKGLISVDNWKGQNYGGNPNGFKFGSVNSTKACVRYIKNCLAFDHVKKGFDNNNSACTASFENCIAFGNGYNYHVPPFTITKWESISGFEGKSLDKLPNGYSVLPTNSQNEVKQKVNQTAKTITDNCKKNIIPEEMYFDIYNNTEVSNLQDNNEKVNDVQVNSSEKSVESSTVKKKVIIKNK